MKKMIAWFATNHVAANLVMGFAVFAGLASLSRIPVKLYPDVDLPLIVVTVPYLGAAPEEVESGVCMRIEESLEGIAGIREVRSISSEGQCTVQVELFYDTDRMRVLGEVENQVNAIETFPEESERPIIQAATSSNVVIEVAVTGPTDERTLKEMGRRVRDDILALPGITQVMIVNERPYEISVEVSEASLSRNNLTFDDVAEALRQRSLDLPGGSVKTDQGEIVLRTAGQAYWGHELERLVVTTKSDGTRVILADVAQVVDGFEDTGQSLAFDGKPAALVHVFRVGNQDIRQVAGTVRRFVADAASEYPAGVELTVWRDTSVTLSFRPQALVDSGIQGLLFVLILLALFLRPHLALWVTAGIPIAFLGAIFLIYWFGFSIDALSVMGFILALGMLVDDAVVVGENVYSVQERGGGKLAGAIKGAQDVLVPVTFGVITTTVAFLPLLFAVGSVGLAYGFMAVVVICCLVFSLIECQMVLPAHLGHGSGRMPFGDFGLTLLATGIIAALVVTPDARSGGALAVVVFAAVCAAHISGLLSKAAAGFTRVQVLFESGLRWLIGAPFRRLAGIAFRQRYVTLAVSVGILASALALVVGGHLPFSIRTPQTGDSVAAKLTMPMGVSERAMEQALGQLSGAADEIRRQLEESTEEPVVLHVLEAKGGQFAAATGISYQVDDVGRHLGEVTMQLTPGETRTITTNEVAALWRDAVGPIADAVELAFVTDRIPGAPEIDIRIGGTEWDEMRAVAAAIRGQLGEFPGVYEIADSLNTGKPEIRLSVTPAGEALGITLADLGRQVRQAFYGEEAQRIQRGRDDIRIMVRYTEQERRSLESLYGLRIRTPDGGEVPFAIVAEVDAGRGFPEIERTNGTRFAWVTADVDPAVTSAAAVLAELDSGFLQRTVAPYPDVSYWFKSAEEQTELTDTLGPLFLFVLLAIYALLAMPLGSYTQPLIIMSVLPFALVGAVWGHALMKSFGIIHGLSVSSLFGVVAASGVVVNSTLVLIHGVNRFQAGGDTLFDALLNSVITRFRPILITTATTFAGLTPLMLNDSTQAQLLVPMAVSLAFGILISAPAALLLVPAFWLVLDDIGSGARRVSSLVGGVIGGAPRLVTWMSRHPYVAESLRSREFRDLELPADLDLDPETARVAQQGLVRLYYEKEFDADAMRDEFNEIAARTRSSDALVGEARTWAEQRTIQLGVHMARGAMAPVDAARPMSTILDTCLAALLAAAKREFANDHGKIPNSRTALIALGAAARRELATGAPLELLFVYDHDPVPAGAIGETPEAWHEQLLQRLMVLVRSLSPEGMLFEPTRPHALKDANGSAPACSMARLREYLDDGTAPVDLRMLTHARVITADQGLAGEFNDLRRSVLSRTRELGPVVREIADIRRQASQHHDAEDIWAIGTFRGGLGDVALAAEYLQLAGAAPAAGVNALHETFDAAANRQLLEADDARELSEAAALWQNLDGFFRMTCGGSFDPKATTPEQKQQIAALAGTDNFDNLLRIISDTAVRTSVHLHELLIRTIRV
ncbi:MAG: efflux RND transporter permease subunit [Gammaproteobacteria bacterium]|nr:efflux RND transporter permease subunit [Gammaproteobacteria bacterium]